LGSSSRLAWYEETVLCADGQPASLKDSQGRFLKKLQVRAVWPSPAYTTYTASCAALHCSGMLACNWWVQRCCCSAPNSFIWLTSCCMQAGERGDREVAFYAAVEQHRQPQGAAAPGGSRSPDASQSAAADSAEDAAHAARIMQRLAQWVPRSCEWGAVWAHASVC
jgi:hypothetical protein